MKKTLVITTILIIFLFCGTRKVKAIEGIDVSEWQGTIDFKKLKNDGIEIVYIRSSAGNSYIDAKFEENYQKAKENDLNIGFYHYVTARNPKEAREQAIFFARVLSDKAADCRLAMDFETFRGLSKSEVNDIAREFLKTLGELTKKELVIYSDAYNASFTFDKKLFEYYPLWIAEYGVKRPEGKEFIGWQYTDRGRINGIRGNVDRDIFYDNIYLSDKSPINKPDIKESDKKKVVYYRIQKKDTLSKIAKKYNTTVKDITNKNKIKNPNIIYPDRIIKIETDYNHKVTSKGDNIVYVVKRGDNLTRIANKYHVTVTNLVTWNNIKNPNLIYPRERIIIKQTNNDHVIKYIVKPYDTLDKIARDYRVSVYELVKINKIKNPNKIYVDEVIYIPENYILERKETN